LSKKRFLGIIVANFSGQVKGVEEVTYEIEKLSAKAGGVLDLLRRTAGAVAVAMVIVALV